MKAHVLDKGNKKKADLSLPIQFSESKRPDVIKKVVLAEQSSNRQAYGTKPRAGMNFAAELSRRRQKYRGSYGFGISRVPRKILSRKGTRMNWVGAVVPGTVGGRKAHPPKANKIWNKNTNKKELNLAIRSAISYSFDKEAVKERGHRIPKEYPFVLSSAFEKIEKTKDFKSELEKLGFKEELERSSIKKIRAGKGKARNRPYKKKKGLLVVVSADCKLNKAAKNVPGIDIISVKDITTESLAPGTVPGRAILFTEDAIKILEKEKLYC